MTLFGLAALWLPVAPAGAASLPGADGSTIHGITEPYRNVVVRAGGKRNPPWTARIEKVPVEEGDAVEAGQVIVELDRTEEELETRIRKLVAESNAEVESATVRERMLREVYEASRQLYDRTKSISLEDVQKKELDYRLAVAERERVEVVKAREKIEWEQAKNSLNHRTMRAPIRGSIVKIFLHAGESCEPNDPLVQIADTSKGVFVGNVEERIGRTLARGQPVELSIQAGPGQVVVTGTIVFVSPIVDPASGLLTVKAEFQNPDGRIRPGISGAMRLRSALQ